MGMSEEEKFIFDLNGYVIRESVLSSDEIIKIKQIELIHGEPDSLPENLVELCRAVRLRCKSIIEGLDVLHEVIGPDIRLEGAFLVRNQGERHGDLHGGGHNE